VDEACVGIDFGPRLEFLDVRFLWNGALRVGPSLRLCCTAVGRTCGFLFGALLVGWGGDLLLRDLVGIFCVCRVVFEVISPVVLGFREEEKNCDKIDASEYSTNL
jgi:uncharacterized membrane protein YfcA